MTRRNRNHERDLLDKLMRDEYGDLDHLTGGQIVVLTVVLCGSVFGLAWALWQLVGGWLT